MAACCGRPTRPASRPPSAPADEAGRRPTSPAPWVHGAASLPGVTIHDEHPFLEPESERDPVRRLRGRLGGAVTLLTSGTGASRTGLTVSSVLVANGDPAHVRALVDPDSDLAARILDTHRAVVHLLQWRHRDAADAFAGVPPSPGGLFTLGSWSASAWGRGLDGVSTWAGVRVVAEPQEVGWSWLLDGSVEQVEVGAEDAPLVHRRGRYVRPAQAR